MMDQWKEAFWLSRMELKHYVATYFLLLICLVFLLIVAVPTMPEYLNNRTTIGLDVFFLLVFTAIVQWCRPKSFRYQGSESGLWVSQHLVMLHQLPIQKDVMIKHRLLSYMMTSFPFHIAFLTLLYVLSPVLRETMPIGAYFAFSVFWMCFSIYFGCSEAASEAGFYRFPVVIRNLFIGLIIAIIFYIVFHKILQLGFVHWIIILCLNYPIAVTLFSVLLAGLGLVYWIRNMRKKMGTMDYY